MHRVLGVVCTCSGTGKSLPLTLSLAALLVPLRERLVKSSTCCLEAFEIGILIVVASPKSPCQIERCGLNTVRSITKNDKPTAIDIKPSHEELTDEKAVKSPTNVSRFLID